MCLLESTVLEECTLDLRHFQGGVAKHGDAINLHLVLLIDIDFQYGFAWLRDIVVLDDVDFCILIALFIEIAFGEQARAVYDVGCDLSVLDQTQLFLQVLLLAFLHAVVCDFRDAGACCQLDMQIGLIIDEAVHTDGDIAEEAVFPVAADGRRYLFTWQGDTLSHLQS